MDSFVIVTFAEGPTLASDIPYGLSLEAVQLKYYPLSFVHTLFFSVVDLGHDMVRRAAAFFFLEVRFWVRYQGYRAPQPL